MICFIL
jgi:hypothetical protein